MTSKNAATPLGLLEYLQLAGVLLAVLALRELDLAAGWSAELVPLAALLGGTAVVLAAWAWQSRQLPDEGPTLRLADTPEQLRPRRRVRRRAASRPQPRVRLSLYVPAVERNTRAQA